MCHSPDSSAIPCPIIQKDHHLVETLEKLENEEKLFAAHDLLDIITGQEIVRFIDDRLLELLGCRLTELSDADMAERICYAFFKREEAFRWWKKMSKLPLFEGLLLAFIFNKMRKLFNSLHEPLVGEEYERLRNAMDEECTSLLQTCYREDDERTMFSLQLNYHTFIHVGECDEHRIQLMEIAYIAKANKFLAHPACQKAIDRRWQPSYRLDQTSSMLFIYYFCPILFLFNNTEPYAKSCQPFWKRLLMFYGAVSSKYVIHMVFRVLYVLLYAFALIRLSGKSMVRNNYTDYREQFIVIAWQCSYLFEMVVIAFQGKFMWWSVRNQVDFYRNVLISINLVTLIVSQLVISTRYFLVPIADACFYLSFLLAVIRSMRVLYVDSFFGAIVHMISKMVPIMVKFGLIFLLFWMSFAVCYISLTGHLHNENHTYYGLPWQIFSHGAFEIFGEAYDNDKEGVIPGCEDFDLNSTKDSSFHCLFRTWMLPLLLFFYMLISGILLVNILTALLTKEYEEVSKDYHIYWKRMIYARLTEYEEKLWVPAPFSIIVYLLQIPVECVLSQKRRIGKWYKRYEGRRNPSTYQAVAQPEPEEPEAVLISDGEKVEEERPHDIKNIPFMDDVQTIPKMAKRMGMVRPRSVHGLTENDVVLPSFRPQLARIASKNVTPTTPMAAMEAAMDLEREAAAAVLNMSEEERAIAFIQERRNEMIREQNEARSMAKAKQQAMEKILAKFDLTLTSRPRGITE